MLYFPSEVKMGPKEKWGGGKKIFRGFAWELGPLTFNLFPTTYAAAVGRMYQKAYVRNS